MFISPESITSSNKYRCHNGIWTFSCDPHREDKISREEIKALFARGGLVIRNCYEFDIDRQTSYWYIIKDSFGGMEELSCRTRNKIRNCNKIMEIKQIHRDILVSEGYEVYSSAVCNYKIKCPLLSKEEFVSRVKNSDENEYWGCIDRETGRLVAFSLNVVTSESCEYRTLKAVPEFRKRYAYYGLFYEMNRYYLDSRKLMYVNDGVRSITNHSNIQPFLIEKFKFKKAYCHIEIFYRLWFKPFVYMLFPFRNYIPSRSIKALLNLESMAREQKNK